ncbi:MAG: FKBP-type peptidyl-prolyl cis-trans isomerase [Candidatus Woesearchaeota archaeon]
MAEKKIIEHTHEHTHDHTSEHVHTPIEAIAQAPIYTFDTTSTIKKSDFISIDYTGTLQSTKMIFDTTRADVAAKNNMQSERPHGSLILKVGEGQLLKALDEFIIGKTTGSYHLDIPAEHAFGKKNAKLLRLISLNEFKKHKIQPYPMLEVDLDGQRGIVRTVNGGRVIVDFNHPFASQDISYDITINGILTDKKQIVSAVLNIFQLPVKELTLEEGKAVVTFTSPIPAEYTDMLKTEFIRLTEIKEVEFK